MRAVHNGIIGPQKFARDAALLRRADTAKFIGVLDHRVVFVVYVDITVMIRIGIQIVGMILQLFCIPIDESIFMDT